MDSNLPDTLIRHRQPGRHKFAGQVREYCQKYRELFRHQLNIQAEALLLKRYWLLFLCGGGIIALNSLKAGSEARYFIPLVGLLALAPLLIKRLLPSFQAYGFYFDFMIEAYALISAFVAIMVVDKGYNLANGPVQTLLIFCGWFAYSPRFVYLAVRNFLYAATMVVPIVILAPSVAYDGFLQGIAGFVGGTLLCYVNYRNQQYKFYALSLKERWNDHLSQQLKEAEETNKSHVQRINAQAQQISSQLDRLTKVELLEMMAQSVQMLAHDVRKPFTVVRFGVQMIQNEKDSEAREKLIQKLAGALEVTSRHVDGMLNDLLAVGKTDEIAADHVSPIQLFVESFVAGVAGEQRQVQLMYDCRHRHLAKVDGIKIQRVFTNIVCNALDASPDVRTIRLKTREADGWMRVGIFNDESYIPPERREELFNVFTRSDKPSGFGLGLGIARQMVQLHGGEIYCESDPKDGTTFWFTLPSSAEADELVKKTLPQAIGHIGDWMQPNAS